MMGADATPNAAAYPQQDLKPEMFRCYFRFFETEDEYFDYSRRDSSAGALEDLRHWPAGPHFEEDLPQ